MGLAPVINPVGSNSSHPWPPTVENPHRVNNVLSLQLWHSLPENDTKLRSVYPFAPAIFKETSCIVSSLMRGPRLPLFHVDHAAQNYSLLHRGRESNGKEKAEACCLVRHCHPTEPSSKLSPNQHTAPPSWASNLPDSPRVAYSPRLLQSKCPLQMLVS